MSTFLIPTQPDMGGPVEPIHEQDGLYALEFTDYAHLRLDGLVRGERSMKRQDPERMSDQTKKRQRLELGDLLQDLIAYDLHEAYKQQQSMGNADDGMLQILDNPVRAKSLFIGPMLDGQVDERSLVIVDPGFNIYGVGIITPVARVMEYERTKRKKFLATGQQITEGILPQAFTKRLTKSLVNFMADSLIIATGQLDAIHNNQPIVIAKPTTQTNAVSATLANRATHFVRANVLSGVERDATGTVNVHPLLRDIVQIHQEVAA